MAKTHVDGVIVGVEHRHNVVMLSSLMLSGMVESVTSVVKSWHRHVRLASDCHHGPSYLNRLVLVNLNRDVIPYMD